MVSNMVTYFQKACAETKCIDVDFTNFEHESLYNLPHQTTLFDCGVFMIVYMDRFNGQFLEDFAPESISEFRKVAPHGIASSSSNNMSSGIEGFKKQKLT